VPLLNVVHKVFEFVSDFPFRVKVGATTGRCTSSVKVCILPKQNRGYDYFPKLIFSHENAQV